MTVLTHNLDTINCSHDGIHGPDSEPGAVQRCHEETVIIRAEGSPEGEALASALHRLTEELLPAYEKRVVREAMRLAAEVGSLSTVVMELDDDYGRSKPWDPEGVTDDH